MANNVYNRAFTGNKEVYKIMQDTFWEALQDNFWSPMLGETTVDGRAVDPLESRPTPTANPIVFHRELTNTQGDIIQVPTIRLAKNMPTISNEQLKDNEEPLFVNHSEVPVDTLRHAVKPLDGKMMGQTTKALRLVENSQPALRDHFARSMTVLGPSYALYYGYSHNVLRGDWFAGHAFIKTISHPHIFIVGLSGGKLPYTSGNPSSAGYETLLSTKIGEIGVSDTLTGKSLRGLKAHPSIRRIKPLIMKAGGKLRFMVLHPYQLNTLIADTEFRTATERILSSTQRVIEDNPILYGAQFIYEGFAIYVSDLAVSPCRDASGVPEFGPSGINTATYTGNLETFENYTTETVFAGYILGSNAVSMAVASAMEPISREDDYGHIKGVGYDIIQGFSRGDAWNRDDGTLGARIVNDGSALIISYAAAPTLD